MPTKTKAEPKLPAREAVAKAEEFVRNLYPKEELTGLRLEAIELSRKESDWLVTLSFIPRVYPETPENGDSLLGQAWVSRLYKEVRVRVADGFVSSMVSSKS
jgi:hypothetical protein